MILINGEPLSTTKFPNKEILLHTENLTNHLGKDLTLEFKFFDNEELLTFLFILSHFDMYRVMNKISCRFNLIIYYMPYSRMDRSQNNNCFTLNHIISMISKNLNDEDQINILEPHSDVTISLFREFIYGCNEPKISVNRINIITPLMNHILAENAEIDMICYPDKGAKQRFQDDSVSLPVVFCNKVRDFNTGEIKGLELDGDTSVQDKNILILDDLSSKGGTFYHTANKLKEYGAKNIYLAVCHMEQTITRGNLLNRRLNWDEDEPSVIKHIYCLDTMLTEIESLNIMESYSNITIYDSRLFLYNKQFNVVKEII